MLYDTGPDNDFLDITPKVQATKSKNSQVGLHKDAPAQQWKQSTK